MDARDETQQLQHRISTIKASEANTDNELRGLEKNYYEKTAQLEDELVRFAVEKAEAYKRLQELRGSRGNFNTAMQPQTSNTSSNSPFLPGSGQTLPSATNTTSNPGESQIYTHANLTSQANPNLLFSLLPHPSGQGLSIPNRDSSNQHASAVSSQTTSGNQPPNLSADNLALSQNGTGPLKRNRKSEGPADAHFKNVESTSARPNIVRRNDSTWVELRCPICATNVDEKGHLINGVLGFEDHLIQSHGYPSLLLHDDDFLRLFTVRQFSQEHIGAILKESPDATSVAKDHRVQRAGEMNVSSATNREMSLSAWIAKWPNVFRRADGTYIELRCGICGANARKNSGKRDGMPLITSFFRVPLSFAYHLRRIHHETYDKKFEKFKNFAEWAVSRCTFRELSLEDLTAMRAKDPECPFPHIIRPNSEAGAEPEKSSSPALDYSDSSAAIDDSDSSVIESDAKPESPNPHKRQRIRVNPTAIMSKTHTHDRTAQHSEKISNNVMNYPRASNHNSPPIILVGSSRIGLQKEDARYDIN